MNYGHLTILLPCHSLEDFPLHHAGDEAANMLHAWTSLWHPALIHAVDDIPGWCRADDPPQDLANRLVVIPSSASPLLLAGWAKRASTEGAVVVREFQSRDEAIQEALAPLDSQPTVDPELVADFLALGYTYLQEELLTRQMRYMSNLDEPHFRAETLAAAAAACEGDVTTARSKLQACFDVLAEARDRFYPVDAYFVDLLLLAETTSSEALTQELARGTATNVLASSGLLQKLADQQSDDGANVIEVLKQAIAAGTCTLVGGDLEEGPLPLQPVEMTGARLRMAAEQYKQILGAAPTIFARRRFGLTPVLPQILSRNGIKSALHFTLDDGQFPRGEQARSRWRGPAPSGVAALTRIPMDSAKPETYLGLCERIGETMDLDHIATLVFARWPGQQAIWFDDLHRAAKYAPVLGRFTTLDKYFDLDGSTPTSNFAADRYRLPYLKQAIIRGEADPISSVASAHQQRHQAEELQTLAVMRRLLDASSEAQQQLSKSQAVLDQLDQAGIAEASQEPATDKVTCAKLAELQSEVLASLDACWPRETKSGTSATSGIMVFNPQSSSRRMAVDVSELEHPPAVDNRLVLAAQDSPALALVEVPACGYAWLTAGDGRPVETPAPTKQSWFRRKPPENPPLAEEETLTLRNEFAEVRIDPHTGAIAAVRDYQHRGNRLSQQIALRRKMSKAAAKTDDGDGPRDDGEYSVMAADEVKVTALGSVVGEIVSKGRLLDLTGKRLADFRQTVRITRGKPVIDISIHLDVADEPRADPWNSYYACRFACPDVGLLWNRSVGMYTRETELKRFESPLFVEADTGHQRTAVLCGGLPYHRIIEEHILDTLLVCRGERCQDFHLGIGLDLKYPVRDSLEFMSRTMGQPSALGPPNGPASGWLFHLDVTNIVATHWDVISEGDRAVGFRVRLLETEEMATRTTLRAMRKLKSARLVDFTGEPLAELTVDGDAISLDFDGCEWVEVEARWG